MIEEEHDNETSPLDEEQLRLLAVGRDELANIYRLRGEIVSRVNELEAYIDTTLASYFGFDQRRTPPDKFRTWVLGRISFSEKLGMMRNVALDVGIENDVAPFFARLARANEVRNNVAHSHVTFGAAPTDREVTLQDVLRYRTVRFSRRGVTELHVTATELTHERDQIAALEVHAAFLMVAMLGRSEERPAALALREIYELNQEEAEIRASFSDGIT